MKPKKLKKISNKNPPIFYRGMRYKKTKLNIFLRVFTNLTKISVVIFCLIFTKIKVFCPNQIIDINKTILDEKNENIENEELNNLIKINSNIIGLVKIDNTSINYPILFCENDENFYLNHNYKKEKSKSGSIFLDSNCKEKFNSKNIVLHGHNMKNGTMFADLLKYSSLNFYKTSPVIVIITQNKVLKFKIFSIFKTNTLENHGKIFNYLKNSFCSKEEFVEFVHKIKSKSLLEIPIEIDDNDRLIMLSTCSYEQENFRTVLVGRLIREFEDERANTDLAYKKPEKFE